MTMLRDQATVRKERRMNEQDLGQAPRQWMAEDTALHLFQIAALMLGDEQQAVSLVEESVAQVIEAQVNGVEQIDVTTFKQQQDAGKDLFLLDVREPHEFKIAQIGGHLIPLGDLQKRVGELDKNREIVVHCKSGGRSQKAAEFLQQAGFKVKNLAGGIQAWSDKIDPRVAKY